MPTEKDDQNSDNRYNPSDEAARSLFDREQQAANTDDSYGLSSRQQKKLDEKLSAADKQLTGYNSNSDDNLRNIDDTRQREEALTSGLYVGRGGAEKRETANFKAILKKRGPLGAIIAVGLGLPTILTIFLSPALLLQQFVETLTGEFNDQLAALDVRSTALLKKKYNSEITSGSCGKVTIRCKYQSVRENSGFAKRLKNAGIEIEGDKSIVPGRVKPTHFIYNGNRIEAKNLLSEARTDPGLRSALRKGYDPLYAAFSDKVAAKVRIKLNLKRSSNIKSSTDTDKMNEDLKKTASGTADLPEGRYKPVFEEDGTTVKNYVDDNGNTVSVETGERLNNQIDLVENRGELAEKITKGGVKRGLKSALTVTSMGAGAVDSACSAYLIVRVAGYAAKIYQQRQLISYAYELVNKPAHMQKYGDMTPEIMNFVMNKLTLENEQGQAALDSPGYRFAANGDTFSPGSFLDPKNFEGDNKMTLDELVLKNQTSRYVNGQLLNNNLMTKLISFITDGKDDAVAAADSTCRFTKSWKGQTLVFGAAILGAVAAFFSGGLTLGVGAVITGGVSIAISVAFAVIEPKLLDMAKGEVIKGDENGFESGNAVVSGAAAMNTHTASGSGLGVATQQSYAAYKATSNQIASKNAEIEQGELSPFDASTKNTFLGAIVSKLLPYAAKQQTVSSLSLAIPSLVTTSLASFGAGQSVHAADNTDKYSNCDDTEYKGLAADPFCNLRYMADGLEEDPDDVLDYMLKGGPNGPYITEEDAAPLGDYKEYVETCFDRETSIGDAFNDPKTGEETIGADDGTQCVIGKGGENEKRNRMFRLFYIDSRVQDGFDEDFDGAAATTSDDGAGASFRVATFNVLHAPDSVNGCSWQCRLDKSAAALQNKKIDIGGMQEMRPEQQDVFKNKYGDMYGMYPQSSGSSGDNQNPDSVVIWDKNKFDLVEGKQKPIKYEGGSRKVNIVKLRYKENSANGPDLYVLNTHDPIDNRAGDGGGPQNRKDNNELYYDTIKNELTDAPVIMTGDFNSKMTVEASQQKPLGSKKENLAYCIMTREKTEGSGDNLLTHVSDAQKGETGCKSTQDVLGRNDVDHIFIDPSMKASNYGVVNRGTNGGDHEMVFSDIEIPSTSSEDTGGTGPVSPDGWAWPVPSIKSMGTLPYGGTGSKGVHKGTDIGPSPTADNKGGGAVIVAAHSGIVNKVWGGGDPCGTYISITATGTPYYAAYQHVDPTSISVTAGQQVTAGQPIAKIGTQGGSTCGSAGFYHLHFSIESSPGMVSAYGDKGPPNNTNGTINPLLLVTPPR